MPSYRDAPSVAAIAAHLIPKHHRHLADFNVEVRCIFRDEAKRSRGHVTLGTASKLTGRSAFLARPDGTNHLGEPVDEYDPGLFVIEIALDQWGRLEPDQRRALVDHELCHCKVDIHEETGLPILAIQEHDIEEFEAVVHRHGLWKEDLRSFADVVADQLETA